MAYVRSAFLNLHPSGPSDANYMDAKFIKTVTLDDLYDHIGHISNSQILSQFVGQFSLKGSKTLFLYNFIIYKQIV